MSELIDNRARRIATLKEIIQHLHKGEAPEAVKSQLREMVQYCSADDLRCGNGTIQMQHPVELFGEDRLEWELDSGPSRTIKATQSRSPNRPANDN